MRIYCERKGNSTSSRLHTRPQLKNTPAMHQEAMCNNGTELQDFISGPVSAQWPQDGGKIEKNNTWTKAMHSGWADTW